MLLAGERERCLIMSRGCVTSCLDRDVVVESALGGAESKVHGEEIISSKKGMRRREDHVAGESGVGVWFGSRYLRKARRWVKCSRNMKVRRP